MWGGARQKRRSHRRRWRLLLSAAWIKTNGVPLLSSQAEKHHVRVCLLLLSLSCHVIISRKKRKKKKPITVTGAGKHSDTHCQYVSLGHARGKSDDCFFFFLEMTHIPWQPYVWPDGRQAQEVTLRPPVFPHLPSPLCKLNCSSISSPSFPPLPILSRI